MYEETLARLQPAEKDRWMHLAVPREELSLPCGATSASFVANDNCFTNRIFIAYLLEQVMQSSELRDPKTNHAAR